MTLINQTDILDCIASLGKDEVFTPPKLANQMLDLLPVEIWSNKETRILDPVSKTGVFLREAAKRLDEGLKEVIKDADQRRSHIFQNMLYGIAITDLTSLISRRTLYYSKQANNEHSVFQFNSEEGNIQYNETKHTFKKNSCIHCGASQESFEYDERRESYAYQFIHEEVDFDMKFDVIIGNPPYHIKDGSGKDGNAYTQIYNLFVEQSIKLKPRYLCMITPSRWFVTGKGLDKFRKNMLSSRNFRTLVHHQNAKDVFESQEIIGGVSYFLWDMQYEGMCEIISKSNNDIISSSKRYLDDFGDILIIKEESVSVIKKVKKVESSFLNDKVASRNPFGIPSTIIGGSNKNSKDSIKIYTKQQESSWIEEKHISRNHEWINKYKVIVGKAYGADVSGPGPYKVINTPIIAEPGSVCSESKLVIGAYKTKAEAIFMAEYMCTKFARFMLNTLKVTQNMTKSTFAHVPQQEYKKKLLTDEFLFKKYNLSPEEIDYIENNFIELDYIS
jgi:site-specific DNA-methyltransferase (adenine-specific)